MSKNKLETIDFQQIHPKDASRKGILITKKHTMNGYKFLCYNVGIADEFNIMNYHYEVTLGSFAIFNSTIKNKSYPVGYITRMRTSSSKLVFKISEYRNSALDYSTPPQDIFLHIKDNSSIFKAKPLSMSLIIDSKVMHNQKPYNSNGLNLMKFSPQVENHAVTSHSNFRLVDISDVCVLECIKMDTKNSQLYVHYTNDLKPWQAFAVCCIKSCIKSI
uniref:Uncharacterized protein n=1 Tax=Megaviridae environmental sample TaxID=1737588 RepID=A0A5J6VJ30_9VIRU|nr:MAG: hypothetical protein [Megaviridae environmental sample]